MMMPPEGFSDESKGEDPENPSANAKGDAPSKVATMATVARTAGCSQGAVSSLLNDRDYGIRVSPKTRERIFKACRDLNYIPNDLRAFVRIYPELGETCLLISNKVPRGVENPFIARLAAGIMAHAIQKPASIGVILYDEAREYDLETDLPNPIKNGTASKVMAVGYRNDSIFRVMHGRSLPALVIGHSSQIPGDTAILPDYAAAARLALGLLFGQGHRHIGIVSGAFGDTEPRLAEMAHAVACAAPGIGLTIQPENVFHGTLDFEAGVTALEAALGRPAMPSAFLCMSEAAAIGVLASAHRHGIRVPEELSVIAFADHARALDACLPLTVVVLPVEEMAAAAVREADRQLREGTPKTAIKTVIPVHLIERSSCGPVKA